MPAAASSRSAQRGLHTRSARSCRGRSHETPWLRARFRPHVALGSRPAPNAVQPARPHQAASSPATLAGGTALAASWASSPRHRRRNRTGICHQVVACLSPSIHVRRAAARRLPSRPAASQWRGSGDHPPGRRCLYDCAGGAVLKKIAARFSFHALRARIRYDSTCYRVTPCETGHSCCRAAHWRTACVLCVVRLSERARLRERDTRASFEGQHARLDSACPSPN